MVCHEPGGKGEGRFTASILTTGSKASVIADMKRVADDDLVRYLRELEASRFNVKSLDGLGHKLAQLGLGGRMLAVLL